MAIQCPQCGTRHDVAEFSRTESIPCRCGYLLNISMLETFDDFIRYFEGEDEKKKANLIQKDAQEICKMILNDECPRIDVEIAVNHLREKVKKLLPDKMLTYQMIYESRFRRLWSQFRPDDQALDV